MFSFANLTVCQLSTASTECAANYNSLTICLKLYYADYDTFH